MPVLKNGKNLSSGQRQLVCFARALLLDSRIVVMDEPTASIDMATDQQIQRLVAEELSGATLIVVAHRISTVIEYDAIMVMNDGEIVEFDSPAALLARPGESAFAAMVDGLGKTEAAALRDRAAAAATSRSGLLLA
jgi:ABC-type multidrug transport system fused ATPase/permease subunit